MSTIDKNSNQSSHADDSEDDIHPTRTQNLLNSTPLDHPVH